jgi:hypothetical protein
MPDQGPAENRAHALVRYLTIVPQAHYAVFDADLQMTLYELFHTNRISASDTRCARRSSGQWRLPI